MGDPRKTKARKPVDLEARQGVAEPKSRSVPEALGDAELMWRSITDASPDYIMLLDRAATILFVNRTVPDLTVSEVVGTTFYDHLPDVSRGTVKDCVNRLLSTGQPDRFEAEYHGRDGSVRHFESRMTPVMREGEVIALIVNSTDITERTKAQEALRESTERYRSLIHDVIDSTAVGVFILDANFQVIWTNGTMGRFLGIPDEDIIGRDKRSLILERVRHIFEEPQKFADRVLATYDDNTYVESFECHVLPDAGREERWLEHWSKPIQSGLYAGGRVELYYDVTRRRRTERALQESETRFRSIFEQAAAGMVVTAPDGRLLQVNPAYCRFLGYTERELLGMTGPEVTHPDDRDATRTRLAEARDGRRHVVDLEKRYIRADGTTVWGHVTAAWIRTGSSEAPYSVAMVQDITERKRAQEKARQLEGDLVHVARTSTMGEMAATLAHELNQPLAAIANYTEGCLNLLRGGQPDTAEMAVALEHVGQLTERAGMIIQRIRNFVHKSEPHRSSVRINGLVREVAVLIEPEARQRGILMDLELAEALGVVPADQIQIQQVVLNLARNGLEAMEDTEPGRRQLTIGTTRVEGDGIEVFVRDTGPGLVAGSSHKIFEPFFTTKPGGLGMGLTISRTILDAHQGRLWVEPGSDRGEGTTIRFSLPVASAESDDGT
jgi:PAS domain S-box-containing protein